MKLWIKLAALSVLLSFGARAQSSPVSDDAGWIAGQYNMVVRATGMESYEYTSVYVLGPASIAPQTMFTCSEKTGLTAAILPNPMTIDEILSSERRDYKIRSGKLAAPGLKPKKDDWVYDRVSGALNTTELWQAQRLYNAAVTQSVATLDVFKIDKLEIPFAPIDDAFRDFVSHCPSLSGN